MANANSTTVSVTPAEVRAALQVIGQEFPNLCRSMEIAEAMILRLETSQNEARLHLGLIETAKDMPDGIRQSVANVGLCLGKRGQRETLMLSDASRKNAHAGQLVEIEVQHA
jgi:hypothetical protein